MRSVRLEDIDALYRLTRQATHGLTSLQLDYTQLLERVESSVFAFSRRSERPAGEPFVLVMEDLPSGQLVGTAAVMAKTGGYEPFYAYRRVCTIRNCPQLGVQQRNESLHLQRIHDGPSEIGSLFLLPEFRGGGRGRLLSLSRFALFAQRPRRFSDRVIAEMRGVCDASGVSPLWEALGRKFYGVDFPVADALSTLSKAFIEQLNPEFPIYLTLLPEAARATIGRVHPETEPALALLRSEGFTETEMVDIFDGGPLVECATHRIAAVARCRRGQVLSIERELDASPTILSSMSTGFAAVLAPAVRVAPGEEGVRIEQSAAEALAVGPGDAVWTLDPHPSPEVLK
ncbi:arginine N-succinyltransferase [Candidatus Laterigemmans baculatus]|uniref:arginine N-succinyltransferase n=1 Tax=Candidatus Laterigemmans baculatus TaxID=2770505 RepID=UPI001F48774B|nr:arginine N-succinyltransferase [Candidatus Laterigemmans baculatus]